MAPKSSSPKKQVRSQRGSQGEPASTDASPSVSSGSHTSLVVEQVEIERLIHDPKNARLHNDRNIDAIKRSLSRFGQQKPIVVRKSDGVVIAGNGTLTAAAALGWTHIAAVWTDLDGAEATAFAIADNRTAELASWDYSVLLNGVNDIQLANIQLEEIGFEVSDIEKYVAATTKSGDADDDKPISHTAEKLAELAKKYEVERGAVWTARMRDSKIVHRIMCGSSTNAQDVSTLLAGASPELMVTDPPYGVNYDPSWRSKTGFRKSGGRDQEVMNDDKAGWLEAYKLFPGSVAYIWHSNLHLNVVRANIVDAGFDVRSVLIWAKNRFAISRGHYHWQHEPCLYAVRSGMSADWIGDRKQTTIWNISILDDDDQKAHGTQKPIECMERPIRNHSGNVYDPFCGSGTTIVAADRQKRASFSMELDEKYVALILERLSSRGMKIIRERN